MYVCVCSTDKIVGFIVTVFMFKTGISVHLPVTHFCMLHLILIRISFCSTKQHASYVMITVNSSPFNIKFHTVPSSLAITAVVCKELPTDTSAVVQAIQIHFFH